ncbi:MAG: hypothetical protein II458_04475 [Oscillospiraceae bacterium]|nr:hypothetical protein [Oscillospiraceae bacterium]
MQIYLAAAPELLARAHSLSVPVAHAAYRIDEAGHLTARELPAMLRGGLLLLCGGETLPSFRPEILCREMVNECQRREFGGAVLDIDGPPSSLSVRLMRLLEEELGRRQKRLYVPETWGDHARTATVLIGTAVSGGTLRQRLEEAKGRFGKRPLALDCQRLVMDFLLPSPNGEGSPLTIDQLARLRQGHNVYFSPDLCARYFTYRTSSRTHFVLFDDADTLRRKLALGEELGIGTAFFMLPEVDDLAGELFGR